MPETSANLIIASKNNAAQQFQVKVDRNVTITNYDDINRNPKNGEVKTNINDGTVQNIFVSQEGHKSNFKELNLSSIKYDIFNALRSLDGNANDLTEEDCKKADTLIGQFGITNIDKSSGGRYKIVFGKGTNDVIVIDFETKIEEMWNSAKGKYHDYCKQKEIKKEEKYQERLRKSYEYCASHYGDKYDIALVSDGFEVSLKEDTNVWQLAMDLGANPANIVLDNRNTPDIHLDDNEYLRSGVNFLLNNETASTGELMYKNTTLTAGSVFFVRISR